MSNKDELLKALEAILAKDSHGYYVAAMPAALREQAIASLTSPEPAQNYVVNQAPNGFMLREPAQQDELPPLPKFDYYVTLSNGDDYGCWSSETMRAYALQARASVQSAPVIADLSMLVKQMARALSKAAPESGWPEKAIDYLKRKDLQGSPLRIDAAEQVQEKK